MPRALNCDRSFEELEHDRWPTPPADATCLVATAHASRRRPIGKPSVEDMRLLIGQDIGLRYVLPLAPKVLRDDPMAAGDMHEGDLLDRYPRTWPRASHDRLGIDRHTT
ncbi:contact-dependent growth inhibition system immunity protein [Streptomyces tauricus]|uniref:contact-dependent growth inhibition system immunity protein n=1 Tax=Streptomyces tauricus TaxID=68274 RepID=UPI002243D8BC|nr:contact-dependent growth inhibition system immunity protein [Streptomyces tauricus]MCW8095138.1 contact-dependent growth inhibition system immunity protein [Streptomyces tauricus]